MSTRAVIWLVGIGVLVAAATALLVPARVPVETARAQRGPMRVVLQDEGETRIEPRHVVASPVPGRMVPVHLEPGDPVQAGQAIASVYPQPLDARGREQAEASLSAARAALVEARAQVQQAGALEEQAGLTLRRNERLSRAGQISQEEMDRSRTSHDALVKALAAARARAEAARYEVETARAALIQSGTGAALPVRVPAAGVVLRVFEDSERVLTAGEPIVETGDPSLMEVVVDVLSTRAVEIPAGAAMTLHAGRDVTLRGRVKRVEPAAFTKISPLGVEEQRVNVIGEITQSAPGVGDRFRVDAEILLWEAADVLAVPAGAVFRADEGWATFVVRDGRALRRLVSVGHRNADAVEILDGLRDGEVVVSYPGDDVADGVRVTAN